MPEPRTPRVEPNDHRPITLHQVLARLFLRHIPVTGWARVTRFVYYISLGFLILYYSLELGRSPTVSTLLGSIVIILPAWGFGWATLALARRHIRKTLPGR